MSRRINDEIASFLHLEQDRAQLQVEINEKFVVNLRSGKYNIEYHKSAYGSDEKIESETASMRFFDPSWSPLLGILNYVVLRESDGHLVVPWYGSSESSAAHNYVNSMSKEEKLKILKAVFPLTRRLLEFGFNLNLEDKAKL